MALRPISEQVRGWVWEAGGRLHSRVFSMPAASQGPGTQK